MIEKSRLEELIKQGIVVYAIKDNYIIEYDLSQKVEKNSFMSCYILKDIDSYKSLFETKEDVEFALRYKHIPRTEYLDLPTWEEFLKDNFGVRFYYKSREFHLHKVRYSADDNNPQWKINIYEDYGDDYGTVAWEKEWDLTKDNYIEACKLAKKLFLGEVVE